MGDVIGLLGFGAAVVAIFLACRRIKTNHARAVAAATATGIATGESNVLARIGASVVVHNHNGDSLRIASGEHYNDHHDNDSAEFLNAAERRFAASLGRDDRGLAAGVPVGVHPRGVDGDVRAIRSASLASLADDDAALRVVRGRGPGA